MILPHFIFSFSSLTLLTSLQFQFHHVLSFSSNTSTASRTTYYARVVSSSLSPFNNNLELNVAAATALKARRNRDNYEEGERQDEDEDENYEYARVGKWRRQKNKFQDSSTSDAKDAGGYSARETSRTNPERTNRRNRKYSDDIYDEVEFDDDEDDDFEYENEDEDDDEDVEDDYNGVIPNALLDQIDPDGAIDRMPELLSDPQFYRDVAIAFVLFMLYAFNRFGNPLYDIKDVNQIDFSKFYNWYIILNNNNIIESACFLLFNIIIVMEVRTHFNIA